VSEPLVERVANIRVGSAFPFRDNPRLAPFLDLVGLHCDGVRYWDDELGMDAPDRLDKLPSLLNTVLSILNDRDEKVAAHRLVETNFLRLCEALRGAGHDDVSERFPQLIEDLKVIGATAPKAHYARPPGPNSAPDLVRLVEWSADFWEEETGEIFAGGNWKSEIGTRFEKNWESGAPNRATQFVVEIVREFAPEWISRLSTVTRKVAKLRKGRVVSE
jgi:hypothetical protein